MSADDVSEMERLRRAWPDAEPPAALEWAVRLQAGRVLAQRRATQAAREESGYPGWLLTLTAGLLAVVVLAGMLPAGRTLWQAAWQGAQLPLGSAWLCLAASNLLAAALAPAVAVWRRSHAL